MRENYENKLTSAELGNLWSTYMIESTTVCVLKHFHEQVVDKDIKSIIKFALDFSEKRLQVIPRIFKQDNIPVPMGFTGNDVDITAPRLFSDSFFLIYLQNKSRAAMLTFGGTLPLLWRNDVRNFFYKALAESIELSERTTSLMISKGLFVKPPYAPVAEQTDIVSKQSFIKDWIGEKRPLSAIEVMHLFGNMQTNVVG